MCGIAGYIGKGNRQLLISMLDRINHRGPDDRGVFVDENAGVGNNRLSIIDLSEKGHQPLFNEDKSLCIVYNGETYNFKNLREKLEKKHKFISHTDSEVVLHAYEEWGSGCLHNFNGMFAFVIYDRNKKLFFGARDRLGEKPLKYYKDGDTFAFASEVKGLLPFVKKREVDLEAINDYLTLQYVPAPNTGLKNVYKLPAGHYFLYSGGKLTVKKYWSAEFDKKLSLSEEEWGELLFAKIRESVESRMVSDVPVGAFLSGGLDSSAVVAFLSQTRSSVKTFSIGFEDERFDESKYADQVAKLYRTDHTSLKVGHKELTDVFVNSSEHFDEPFADNSAVPSIILSQLARKNVKVALSGDGGDENFGGYERYGIVDIDNTYQKAPRLAKSMLTHSSKAFSRLYPSMFSQRASTFSKIAGLPFYEKYVYYNSFFNSTEKVGIYSDDAIKQLKEKDTFMIYRSMYKNSLSNLDNAFNFDINSYLPEDLLYKMDTSSMSSSLEVRAPFLNHELIELTSQMPASLKVRMFNKKYIFKKLLKKKKMLPESIINRPKRGFVAPIESWLKSDLKEYVFDVTSSKKMRNLQIFDDKKLDSYLNDYFQGKIKNSNNVFALVSLSAWVNRYL